MLWLGMTAGKEWLGESHCCSFMLLAWVLFTLRLLPSFSSLSLFYRLSSTTRSLALGHLSLCPCLPLLLRQPSSTELQTHKIQHLSTVYSPILTPQYSISILLFPHFWIPRQWQSLVWSWLQHILVNKQDLKRILLYSARWNCYCIFSKHTPIRYSDAYLDSDEILHTRSYRIYGTKIFQADWSLPAASYTSCRDTV